MHIDAELILLRFGCGSQPGALNPGTFSMVNQGPPDIDP